MIITYKMGNQFSVRLAKGVLKVSPTVSFGSYNIESEGEYEIAGVEVIVTKRGIWVGDKDSNVAILRGMKGSLTEQEIEILGNSDTVAISLGKDGYSVAQALEYINVLEPKNIIVADGEDLSAFCKEFGSCPAPVEQVKISKKDLGEGEQELFVLKST